MSLLPVEAHPTSIPGSGDLGDYCNPTEYTSIAGITRQVGFYLQDKWQVPPRLTINFGARFDRQNQH